MAEAAAPARAPSHLLSLDDAGAIKAFGDLLRSATYTEPEIRRACGSSNAGIVTRSEVAYLVRRLPEEGLLPVLIRLFMIGQRVDRAVADRALAAFPPPQLEALGLVRLADGAVVPRVKITPFHPLLLVGDPHYQDALAVPADYVIPVNQTSVNLVALTVRRPVKATLDLGTGCGVLALYASSFSERVVATDINPRALNFTAFNARLNNISNVEVRQGSLFEPVAGEMFDVIASNPPYVISPDSDYQYRDSGRGGDTLCRDVVLGIPRHLREGGYASTLANWAVRPGQHWSDPVKEWIRDSGCDTLILHTYTESPLKYAADWNRPLLPDRPKDYEATIDRWHAFFTRSGIEGIANGGLVMRRRSGGANWTGTEDLPVAGASETGDQIVRSFEARDWLATQPDLLAAKFRPIEDLHFEQTVVVKNGEMAIQDVRFSLPGGFQMEGRLEPRLLMVIGNCNGQATLGEILQKLGVPPDAGELRTRVINTLRGLYSLGYLLRG